MQLDYDFNRSYLSSFMNVYWVAVQSFGHSDPTRCQKSYRVGQTDVHIPTNSDGQHFLLIQNSLLHGRSSWSIREILLRLILMSSSGFNLDFGLPFEYLREMLDEMKASTPTTSKLANRARYGCVMD